jgi:hypothetical protein
MPVERRMFDDESDLYYVLPNQPGKVYTSRDLSELSSVERRRLQRLDPSRPWLVDGAMPRQAGVNPIVELRRDVYIRDRFTCQDRDCGRQFISEKTLARDDFCYDGLHNVRGLTLGHVIPKSKGGGYTLDNIKAQCQQCNNRLGDNVWTNFF